MSDSSPRNRSSVKKNQRIKIVWAAVLIVICLIGAVVLWLRQHPPLPPIRIDLEQPVLSPPTATVEQAERWARRNRADEDFVELAALYWRIGTETGVNPVVAYAQAAIETDFMRFGGVIDASYHNPCGLKTHAGGDDDDPDVHQRFTDWEEGVRAQFEHLALYAGQTGYPLAEPTDPRHFPYLLGEAKTVGQIGERWASAAHYGETLAELIDRIEVTP
jgi:hypothetical protein